MVRSMMSITELPLSFWEYALETAARLLNTMPSKAVTQTPYQIWHDKPASYKYLRVWGSHVCVKMLVGDKLDSRDFPTDTRRGELLLEESSEAPQSNAGTSSAPIVSTYNVPILRRSARMPQPPESHGQGNTDYACHSSVYDYEIWHMDIKTAFFNGFVDKEIYMDQLEGFTVVGE
ncbi:hypothetical protein Sango_0650300 [Sesamum angolense]|uniref:Uncharacterized protein n=1 Tax=Sesamum angolense TaxID=2727404 RepID=A0AAE1X7W3_9LAMI|nr:hypothetical protein Sango_0650300 [Sesamum angolense]